MQLDEIRKVDQQLTVAITDMEQKLAQLKSMKDSAESIMRETDAKGGDNFQSLFSSESFFGFPSTTDDIPSMPLLVRQSAHEPKKDSQEGSCLPTDERSFVSFFS
jgi:hypothetical protein